MNSISSHERLTARLTLLSWGSVCFFAGMSTSMFLIWGLHGNLMRNSETQSKQNLQVIYSQEEALPCQNRF